jgi:acyl-CoA reductase-like NAD-dependent aldehyde dehydrogenase
MQRTASERADDARYDAARLRAEAGELRALAALLSRESERERLRAMARELDEAAERMTRLMGELERDGEGVPG